MTTAGGGDEAAQDVATAALRRLMQSGDDEATRMQLLTSLLPRSVVVATWPGTAEAVRTLTNSAGEQAMPLFTGRDLLQASAARFGWLNPDGSLSFRELPAREALRSALAHNVQFVVLDIGAEHATEFAREEVERVLQAPRAAAAAAQKARPYAHAADATPGSAARLPRGLAEIDLPFAEERGTNRTALPPRDAASDSATATATSDSARREGRVERRAQQQTRPLPHTDLLALQNAHAQQGERTQIAHAQQGERTQIARAQPAQAHPAIAAQGAARTRKPVETVPFDTTVLAAAAPARRQTDAGIAPPHIPSPPFAAQPAREPSAPSAPQPAREPFKAAPVSLPPLGDSMPLPALELDIQAVPSKGRMPQARPDTSAMPMAPKPADESDKAEQARRGSPEDSPVQDGAADSPGASGTSAHARFHALGVSLPEELLGAISDFLRRYPEVEWACQVSDDSAASIIGLRIAPAFLTRAEEIRNGVSQVGQTRGSPLLVLVLGDREQMRAAREQGDVFFPWRRRGKRPPPAQAP